MENLKGTYTEENLKKAMSRAASAFIQYQIYAKLLENKFEGVGNKINNIAYDEKEHYKIWAKILLQDEYYNDKINLLNAISGEIYESQDLYPNFARIAREEGFEEIAEEFEQIANVKCEHSYLLENLLDIVFKE